eukprot:CAMPEP_0183555582 /NCGR_PEP_ID=MMETSP0371-20130417/79835_1 /TAXON_ID=268820 /ORGANISM="Peridinium aciculiferum, Strain PAER-2" /LENGTH=62 /DNA_ID=CAMNT_0025761825 /DNA_START=34 /DNA_END=219 /DNA_ORIENTATION=-
MPTSNIVKVPRPSEAQIWALSEPSPQEGPEHTASSPQSELAIATAAQNDQAGSNCRTHAELG